MSSKILSPQPVEVQWIAENGVRAVARDLAPVHVDG
jgi:hypothetical protein